MERNERVFLEKFGLNNFSVIDQPFAPLAANEVRIEVKAASINYRDLLVAEGLYAQNIKFPLVPLSDAAGEVVEIGSAVTKWQVGDRVMPGFMPNWIAGKITPKAALTALGAFVDGVLGRYFSWEEHGFAKIPEHLSYVEASTLPCAALTAWNALFEQRNARPGETLLILGTGGVSTFALQFAISSGMKVIATTSDKDKGKQLLKMGVKEVINYINEPEWGKLAAQLAGSQGIDQVIEVGGAGTLRQSIEAVKMGGTISLIGVLSGPGEIDPRPLLMKHIDMQGIFVGSMEMFQRMNQAIEINKIKPVVDKVFKFEELSLALNYLVSKKHFGKLAIEL